MATLNLVLDKRRVKKDSTYPIVFRLSANRKQAFIPTGISINEQDYDEKNSLVINSPRLNEDIYKLDRIYRKRFYQYIIENSGCEDVLVLNYEKLSYEALNRHFCKTAVSCWASFCQRSVVTSLHCPRAMACWLLWNF